MAIHGSEGSNSQAAEITPLNALKDKLDAQFTLYADIAKKIHRKRSHGERYDIDLEQVPEPFRVLGLTWPNDIAFLFEDIRNQLYKFYDCEPGDLIKLTSMITPPHGITVYATKDIEGNFKIILQRYNPDDQSEVVWQIQDNPLAPWQHDATFMQRCQQKKSQFEKELPKHFAPYLSENLLAYFTTIEEKSDEISDLDRGEILTIEANVAQHRACHLHILRTQSGEYRLLVETGNDSEPFLRLDANEKQVWDRKDGAFLDINAILFLNKLAKTQAHFTPPDAVVPGNVAHVITKDMLLRTYEYMLSNPHIISGLMNGQSFRVSKELSGLPRTINIVRMPDGEYKLMLETKRKLASGRKARTRLIGEGTYGSVKPCYSIETTFIEEWVNKVTKGDIVQEADYEAIYSQHLVEAQSVDTNINNIINITVLGELFSKPDATKRSQYSKRAVGDLKQMLKDPDIHFTDKDIERITRNILEGIAFLHAQGKVHQDIKLGNVFIYQDEDGYYAKLADFGISYDPKYPTNKPALASGGYESPEIQYGTESPGADQHKYYHTNGFISNHSLGYAYNELSKTSPEHDPDSDEAKTFRKPNPANDMWAIGILLFQLQTKNYNRWPKLGYSADDKVIQASPLLKQMLEPNRNSRITAENALTLVGGTPKDIASSAHVSAASSGSVEVVDSVSSVMFTKDAKARSAARTLPKASNTLPKDDKKSGKIKPNR